MVNDLIYTGCVSGVQLVTRPWLPARAKNGTGEDLITDGKIAVLQLNACEHPIDETAGQQNMILRTHGNQLDRTTRQTVLTLKNNIIRDNVGVMAYSGIRYAIDAKKEKKPEGPERSMDVNGEKYTIHQTFNPNEDYTTLSARPVVKSAASATTGETRMWSPPSVELGFHGGFHGYYGGNGGGAAYIFTDDSNPEGAPLLLVLANTLHDGWELGGTVTLNPQRYLSHEFSYDHSFTGFSLALGVIGTDSTSGSEINQIVLAPAGLRTSQFAYNLLVNLRPKTARLRPYVAVGPSLQLMHLADAPIKKAPGWFHLGLSNIGLISAAYNFGSDPPLEGGGIFQAGLNYGGGVRYRLTPRWMVRADFRETLTSQPDFWTKSQTDILAGIVVDSQTTLTVVGPVLDGPLRQDRVAAGMSFTF